MGRGEIQGREMVSYGGTGRRGSVSTIPQTVEEGWENRTEGKEERLVTEDELKKREGVFG